METAIFQNAWTKGKVLVKTLIIGLIILILQIPVYLVNDLIAEREARQKEAVAEVSGKWARKQNITGPVIVLPYWEMAKDSVKTIHYASFLPDNLSITAQINPQEKYRGIYKVMLYNANVKMKGSFGQINTGKLMLAPGNIIWDKVFLKIKISDIKGLKDEMKIIWNNKSLPTSPEPSLDKTGETDLIAPLNPNNIKELHNAQFNIEWKMNGSEQFLVTPVGKTTNVTINSSWPDPSFTGNILPQSSVINKNGFTASWQSFKHNRAFPQEFRNEDYVMDNSEAINNNIVTSAFGVDILVPVSAYQKTTRSVKYSMLCILLTFAAFFLIETNNKKSVHPFQYGLIGIALTLFYTLLLSFSEYISFNLSYIIASAATIGLIGWFVKGIFTSFKLSLLLPSILIFIYSYVFVLLQLQDYALLLGSIGLFITLAIIMHFSRKMQW